MTWCIENIDYTAQGMRGEHSSNDAVMKTPAPQTHTNDPRTDVYDPPDCVTWIHDN
jgi:hypothetical protein